MGYPKCSVPFCLAPATASISAGDGLQYYCKKHLDVKVGSLNGCTCIAATLSNQFTQVEISALADRMSNLRHELGALLSSEHKIVIITHFNGE